MVSLRPAPARVSQVPVILNLGVVGNLANLMFKVLNISFVKMVFPHLVEPGEWVILPLLGDPPPVVEDEAVLPGGVGEGHPLPGPHLPHAELGAHLLVALVLAAVCRRDKCYSGHLELHTATSYLWV